MSDTTSNIVETCKCGAVLTASGDWTDVANQQSRFHKQHRDCFATSGDGEAK